MNGVGVHIVGLTQQQINQMNVMQPMQILNNGMNAVQIPSTPQQIMSNGSAAYLSPLATTPRFAATPRGINQPQLNELINFNNINMAATPSPQLQSNANNHTNLRI
eukprot:396248_1